MFEMLESSFQKTSMHIWSTLHVDNITESQPFSCGRLYYLKCTNYSQLVFIPWYLLHFRVKAQFPYA
jgi:hypothetical protein